MKIIIKPVVTEKSTKLAEKGKYELIVVSKATKIEVKKEFKKLYGVDAKEVNVIKVPKKVRLGKNRAELTKRAAAKKVIVTTKNKAVVDLTKIKA